MAICNIAINKWSGEKSGEPDKVDAYAERLSGSNDMLLKVNYESGSFTGRQRIPAHIGLYHPLGAKFFHSASLVC